MSAARPRLPAWDCTMSAKVVLATAGPAASALVLLGAVAHELPGGMVVFSLADRFHRATLDRCCGTGAAHSARDGRRAARKHPELGTGFRGRCSSGCSRQVADAVCRSGTGGSGCTDTPRSGCNHRSRCGVGRTDLPGDLVTTQRTDLCTRIAAGRSPAAMRSDKRPAQVYPLPPTGWRSRLRQQLAERSGRV